MADEEPVSEKAAVYVGWTTFKNAVESLAQGLPNVVDRTAFPGQSGGVQSQLLAGLKFLGLINEAGKPTAALVALAVDDEDERKAQLKAILEQRYKAVIDIDLTKATLAQLNQKMSESYGVTGDTREKSVRFFMSAAEYVGIPLGRFLRPAPGAPQPMKKRAPRKQTNGELATPPAATQPAPVDGSTSQTVKLESGGTLTLTASVDLFQMSAADRDFVFTLIDKLRDYGNAKSKNDAQPKS